MLKQSSAPEDTAAILIEPIQGEGGFLTPPPGFLDGLRKICNDNNIMLIMDEVWVAKFRKLNGQLCVARLHSSRNARGLL